MYFWTLRKAKKILFHTYFLFRSKRKKLSEEQAKEIQRAVEALQNSILNNQKDQAKEHAKQCQMVAHKYLKKSFLEQSVEIILGLAFALAIALVIRQDWFELYEIPTGSMRPTLKEQDRLMVTKTTFGLNVPFSPGHFYFDPSLVERMGIFCFTAENMDIKDQDTMYFYIFPGKKQLVKRLIGKPGDLLYFYGGKIYGVDKEGNDISSELQLDSLNHIEHIPVMSFEGNVTLLDAAKSLSGELYRSAIIHQMNEPIARLNVLNDRRLEGELLKLGSTHSSQAPLPKNYGQLWGINNFAAGRLLTVDQAKQIASKLNLTLADGVLYLELKHHPSLKALRLGKDPYGRLRPMFYLSTSLIPLSEDHVRSLFSNLYTARFLVKNGYAMRYSYIQKMSPMHFLIPLPGVPDGCYEFYNGKIYEIGWQGIAKTLDSSHPLSQFSIEKTRLLYNHGFDFDIRAALNPENGETARSIYFREGALYTMASVLLKKEDSVLQAFTQQENLRKTSANMQNPYEPFLDEGAPMNQEGKIDLQKLQQYGLLIPSQSYFALGDNHAMSGDSREFGFVPQANLRGAPFFIFFPTGSRFGIPNQPHYPWMTFPKVLVSSIALCIFLGWYMWHRRRHKLPIKWN